MRIGRNKWFNGLLGALSALALAAAFSLPAAASDFKGTVRLTVAADYTKSMDLSTARDRLDKVFEQLFTTGTGSSQANVLWHDERTLTDGSNENLDLSGVLMDSFGDSVALVKVKGLIIKNQSTTQTLSVGGAASAQFSTWVGAVTDIVKVPPGGVLCLFNPAGYTVTNTTADLLKILNSAGASCIYDIIIIGNGA